MGKGQTTAASGRPREGVGMESTLVEPWLKRVPAFLRKLLVGPDAVESRVAAVLLKCTALAK